ncbi:MAG: HlyD family secretion protein [Prochlorococcaceae cyanobacterium]|jgi:multidrug resistance efflux pump
MPADPPDPKKSALVRTRQGSLARSGAIEPARADLLPKLAMDDYVPSVRPWLRFGTTAVIASAGLGVLFLAVCPYRVVVRGEGSVRPAGEQVLVNAPFEGRVVSIDVRTNQPVTIGQPIVTLDPSRLRGEVEQVGKSRGALEQQLQALEAQSRAEYARAELEVEKNRSTLAFARSEFERYQTLVRQGAASASLVEAKLAEFREAQASLQQAMEGLEAARSKARTREAELRKEMATIEQSSAEGKRNLRNAVVRSPVKGVVFQLQVQNPQQTISAGQPLATITPSKAERVVKVTVRGEDVDNVKAGQRADLRVAGCPYPDYGTLQARVMSVSPDALPVDNAVEGTEGAARVSDLFEVTLKPKSPSLVQGNRRCEVKLGMRLQADITTRQETLLRFVLRKTRILVGQ